MCDQIVQFSRTECFAGISWEGLTRDMLAKPTCHHLYWLLTFQLCASHMLPFRGMLSREIPAKNLLDWLLAFQSCASHMLPFCRMFSCEIPAKNLLDWPLAFQSCVGHMFLFAGCLVARYLRKPFWLQMLESSHSLSLSHNPYNKFPHKYRVYKIE